MTFARGGRPRGADRGQESGKPLDPAMKQRAESATGERLDHVRVHDDAQAREWVDGMGAMGASLGPDLALGSGARGGVLREAVLAHEVAHAAQSRDHVSHGPTVVDQSAEAEVDADRAAAGILLGERVQPRTVRRPMGLHRCNGDAPPKVKDAAAKTDPAKLSGFEKMVKGGVPAADAAKAMQLPKELTDAMAEAWKNSFPGGKSKEQGGILVKKADGTLGWVKATKTTGGATTLPWGDVPSGAVPLVDAHTHPYDAGEGGHKGVAFSGGDFSTMPADPTKVSMVYAGDRIFALAKTKEFDDAVAAKSGPDKTKYGEEMQAEWDKVFSGSKGNIVVAAREGTVAVCRKFSLTLYEGGIDGQLTKVDLTK